MSKDNIGSIFLNIQKYISYPKSVTFYTFCGFVLIFVSIIDPFNESLLSLFIFTFIQLIYLMSLFTGIMITMYNLAISVFVETFDKDLTYTTESENRFYRRKLKRAILMTLYWFLGVVFLHIIFQNDDIILIAGICFLLTVFLFFLEKDEFPFVQGF